MSIWRYADSFPVSENQKVALFHKKAVQHLRKNVVLLTHENTRQHSNGSVLPTKKQMANGKKADLAKQLELHIRR